MNKRNILIEASDGIDVSMMGYTHSDLRMTASLSPQKFIETPPVVAQPEPTPERWWQTAWRILNTDIFELWRRYGPKGFRRS